MMNHRIHRQRWQVKAPSQQAAFALRGQLRAHLDTALLPVFERAFDALAPGDEVIHIPRLTLEIKLKPGSLNGDFIAALTAALPEALRDELDGILRETPAARTGPARQNAPSQARTGQAQSGQAQTCQAQTGHSEQGAARPGQTGARRLGASASLRNTLLHYLSTGLLEWYERDSSDEETLSQMLRKEAAALTGDASALQETLDGISGDSLSLRLAASFRLLQLLPSESRQAVSATALHHAGLTGTPTARSSGFTALLRRFADADFPDSRFAQSLGSHLLLRVQAMLLALRESDLHRPPDGQIAGLLQACLHQVAAGGETAEMLAAIETLLSSGDVTAGGMPPPDTRPALPLQAAPPPLPHPSPSPQTDVAPDIGYLANDAGLILLHPFLPRLFEVTEIAPGGILPAAMLPRAAALLHWLVSARDEVYEYELTLIKVLLGLAPDSTLPVSADLLDKADRDEADALLAAAIAHWGALGKTSVSAMRATFLQRRGLLRDADSGWQLQMEPAPYDLLLGRLPWSISLVRLPWMSRPVYTEWNAP